MPGSALTPYPWRRVPHLAMRIRYGQAPQAHEQLDQLLDEFDVEHGQRLGPRKMRCAMLMSYCLRGARLGGGPSEPLLKTLMQGIDVLSNQRSWPAVRRMMHLYLDQLLQYVNPQSQSRLVRLVGQMQRQLLNEPEQHVSLQGYAQLAQVHPDYLSRQFKKITGQTFGQTRCAGRLARAKHLLIASRDKIHVVAARVGMGDVSQFMKVFKRETGYTPRAYRLVHQRG